MLGRVIIWSFVIEIIGSVVLYFSWMQPFHFKTFGIKYSHLYFIRFQPLITQGFRCLQTGFTMNTFEQIPGTQCNDCSCIYRCAGFYSDFRYLQFKKGQRADQTSLETIGIRTKIALYFSLGLVIFGAVFFYILESENTLQGQSMIGKVTGALFQSTTRTSGFNTVDIGAIGPPMIILLIFLMFVGSSSSSTGGGIKTSTFAILVASTISTIKGKKNTELFKRSISTDMVFRAYSVFLFFVVGNLVSIFLLSITESHILAQEGRTLLDLIFEEVSAFGTVGYQPESPISFLQPVN